MPKKILIADDEEMIRNAVKLSLQNEDYEIHEAKDGYEALEIAKRILPDLVILDVMMPGMIGYRVCQEIKNNPATKHATVVFLTARGYDTVDDAVQDSGGDGLISKPFLPKELREKVKEILGD